LILNTLIEGSALGFNATHQLSFDSGFRFGSRRVRDKRWNWSERPAAAVFWVAVPQRAPRAAATDYFCKCRIKFAEARRQVEQQIKIKQREEAVPAV
jgi:hypothetical protein